MPRFKFSQRILESQPNAGDMNSISKDFEDYINTYKLGKGNVQDAAIRHRHLSEVPTKLLYKDCSEDIFRTGNTTTAHTLETHNNFYSSGTSSTSEDGEWQILKTRSPDPDGDLYDNSSRIDFSYQAGSIPSDEVYAEITAIYHPYSMGSRCYIALAYYTDDDGWVVDKDTQQQVGHLAGCSGEADMQPYYHGYLTQYPDHPCLLGNTNESSLIPSYKTWTGKPNTDILKTAAHASQVKVQLQVKPTYPYNKFGVDLHHVKAFGLAVYVPKYENLTKSGKLGTADTSSGFVIEEVPEHEWIINHPDGFHNWSMAFGSEWGTGHRHIVFSSVFFESTVSRFDKLVLYSVVRDST